MTTSTFEKTITFDRETKDFKMELDGRLIGYARTKHEAEVTLDQVVREMLTHGDCATAEQLDGGIEEGEGPGGALDFEGDDSDFDDDYADAMWESAHGSYNGKVPSDFTNPEADPPAEPSPLGDDEGDSLPGAEVNWGSAPAAIAIGQRFEHIAFGHGTVINITDDERLNVQVQFDRPSRYGSKFWFDTDEVIRPRAVTAQSIQIDQTLQRNRVTREIPLTQNKIAIVDAADFEWLSQWKWHYHIKGYAARTDSRKNGMKSILMHRAILDVADDVEVDHRDRNKLNNTRSNLRVATHAQNRYNTSTDSQSNNTSKYKGVGQIKNEKWRARIRLGEQEIHIGVFDNEIDAAKAYDQAARHHFGEFAFVNFPDEHRCKSCGGSHFIQACPELRAALLAPDAPPPWFDIDLGRELCRMRWRDFKAFVALLLSVPSAHLVIYAASYQAYIKANAPQSDLTINDVLSSWAREMAGEPMPLIKAAA